MRGWEPYAVPAWLLDEVAERVEARDAQDRRKKSLHGPAVAFVRRAAKSPTGGLTRDPDELAIKIDTDADTARQVITLMGGLVVHEDGEVRVEAFKAQATRREVDSARGAAGGTATHSSNLLRRRLDHDGSEPLQVVVERQKQAMLRAIGIRGNAWKFWDRLRPCKRGRRPAAPRALRRALSESYGSVDEQIAKVAGKYGCTDLVRWVTGKAKAALNALHEAGEDIFEAILTVLVDAWARWMLAPLRGNGSDGFHPPAPAAPGGGGLRHVGHSLPFNRGPP